MGWAGLSELWGFPPIWQGLEVFLRRLHGINLWAPYLGCGDPPSFSVFRALQWQLPFCPLLMDFLCVCVTTLHFWMCSGSLFSVWAFMFLCFTYIHNITQITGVLFYGFLQTKHTLHPVIRWRTWTFSAARWPCSPASAHSSQGDV